jgi:hypothetical protein
VAGDGVDEADRRVEAFTNFAGRRLNRVVKGG